MSNVLKKMVRSFNSDDFGSLDAFRAAGKREGFSSASIDSAVSELGKMGIDSATLKTVVGGNNSVDGSWEPWKFCDGRTNNPDNDCSSCPKYWTDCWC